MHSNDNKTRARELGHPGLERMRLVAFCALIVEELFRSVISYETNYVGGQETDRKTSDILCHLIPSLPLVAFSLLWEIDNDISCDVRKGDEDVKVNARAL